MQEYYFKPDDRKPWQKNMLLAFIVLIMLYIAEAIINMLRPIVFFTGNLFEKANKPKANESELLKPVKNKQPQHSISGNLQTTN